MEKNTEIINWAKESLGAKGYILNGSPEVVQATPWSSVTRFSTSSGHVYLKQTPPGLSLEPVITKILHAQFHASVPEVIAMNKDLDCFLMEGCGFSLRELLKSNFQPDLLCQAIKEYTYIQAVVGEHLDMFFELGVPDWRLEKLPLLYDELVGKEDLLQADGMTTDELRLLQELSSKLLSMCDILSGFKIPPTLDHCDFHDGNILIEPDTKNMTIIDWGETVITHPFFSLITFLNTAVRHYSLKEVDQVYVDLQDACFENWHELLSQVRLVEAISLSKKLWPVYAALGFCRLMMSSQAEEFKSLFGRLSGCLRGFIKATEEYDGVTECCVMEFLSDKMEVVLLNKSLEKQTVEFLNKHEETSLFLLSNLKNYGATLTDDTYSGNFKCLLKNKEIVAVFALTRIGNLLVQTDHKADYSEVIVNACLKESVSFRGVISDWEIAKPIWECAKLRIPFFKENVCKKEILFKLSMGNLVNIESKHTIEYLKESNYAEWSALHRVLMSELKLNLDQEDAEAERKRFLQDTNNKNWLGLFVDGRLVSIAAYIARFGNTGQIGSIFTASDMRRRGLMKELIVQLLLDGKNNKKMEKVILFTDENNYAAIGLYEGLGFKRIGYFGLLFGEHQN
ncbi:MAG: hypothetical protein ACD_21C00083G0007 [uncultured bacterium]|nr:MAG: hypothetical protein ACD_21C00083G0007 [uncultured bacterium]